MPLLKCLSKSINLTKKAMASEISVFRSMAFLLLQSLIYSAAEITSS